MRSHAVIHPPVGAAATSEHAHTIGPLAVNVFVYQMLFEHRAIGKGCSQHDISHNAHLQISPRTAAVLRADILLAESDERSWPAQVDVCAADVMLHEMLLGADPLGKAAAGMRSYATASPVLTWASFHLKCIFIFSTGHCRWMCGRWVSCCTRCCLGADPLGRVAARRKFCAMRSCSRPSMSPSLQSLPSLQNARTSSHGKPTTPRTGTVTAFCPTQSLHKAQWDSFGRDPARKTSCAMGSY